MILKRGSMSLDRGVDDTQQGAQRHAIEGSMTVTMGVNDSQQGGQCHSIGGSITLNKGVLSRPYPRPTRRSAPTWAGTTPGARTRRLVCAAAAAG